MFTTILALQAVLTQPVPPAPIGVRFTPPASPAAASFFVVDTPPARPQRPRAFVYSDGYATRLTIHQWTSWGMLPLFGAEYLVGQRLYRDGGEDGLKDTHTALATGIGGLFAINTVTGAWNLWEARKDPQGRTRRWVHGAAMIAAGAGFVATAAAAPDDDDEGGDGGGKELHRTLAISSASLALASWVMMLVWKE